MIRFVIVEDNLLHMKKTKDIIIKYMMRNNYDFDIKEYSKIDNSFNSVINDDNNYIYILDFELGDTNAIEVARKIRKTDWVSPIIVFSVNGGMAFETFKQRLQILDFVSKQYEAEKNLFELFDLCFKQLNVHTCLKYRVGKVDYSLDFKKILYIYKDSVERKCIVVTETGEHKVPMSLVNIKLLLPDYFRFSHKSCIINTERIETIDWCKRIVTFNNGFKCDILSKSHKDEVCII